MFEASKIDDYEVLSFSNFSYVCMYIIMSAR